MTSEKVEKIKSVNLSMKMTVDEMVPGAHHTDCAGRFFLGNLEEASSASRLSALLAVVGGTEGTMGATSTATEAEEAA